MSGTRFLVGNEIGLVDFDVLDDRSDPAEPDAFGYRAAFGRFGLAVLEQMIHGGAARIGDADRDVFFLFAQETRCAGNGAAGADRADEAVDIAVASRPRFPDRSRRNVPCGCRDCSIDRRRYAVLFGLLQLLGEPPTDMLVIVRVAIGSGRHLHQFGAAEPQHVLLFLALRLRDDDHRAIAARIGDQREADAGIAGGRLDNQPAGHAIRRAFPPP